MIRILALVVAGACVLSAGCKRSGEPPTEVKAATGNGAQPSAALVKGAGSVAAGSGAVESVAAGPVAAESVAAGPNVIGATGVSGRTEPAGSLAGSATWPSASAEGAFPAPPLDFDAAMLLSVGNSGTTGCTTRAVAGWARVRCEPKNLSGGTLVGARVTHGAAPDANANIKPEADGSLTLVLPWRKGQYSEARFEWTDMKQDLVLRARGSKFTRVLPAEQAAQCERFSRTSEQILAGIRAKIGPFSPAVTPKDVYQFPKLGQCKMAGHNAWALGLEKLKASGEGKNRELLVTLSLNHIDASGMVASAPFGPLTFAPEGLLLPELMTFDYNDDGEEEVVVRQEILLRAARSMTKPLPERAAVFTYQEGRVVPYESLAPLASGGIMAEHLEPDGRPDVGDYGPFIAWLPEACGRGECEARITGPRFFQRSLPNGAFTAEDEHVERVIRNKCERTPKELVVDVRTLLGKRQTAQNVACARVRGDDPQAIVAQLDELASEMCNDGQPKCAFYNAMVQWARATPKRNVALSGAK